MKTLKQLREAYDSKTLSQGAPEDLVLEALSKPKKELGDYKSKAFEVPSPIAMPNLLMFRRITYRRYPDNQTVALYYSKSVDKYLSIPFGPTGNLNLSEATIYDTMDELDLAEGAKWEAVKGGLKGAAHGAVRGFARGSAIAAEPGMAVGSLVGAGVGAYKGAKAAYKKAKDEGIDEDWQSVNRKDKTDGLSQKAVNAYRRENPGSKLKTAVTEKNPTGKRASRRKSFCSRMGGMKKRLTSAKTARDPDSRINKALRRWNCEEDFKLKLNEKRGEKVDENIAAILRIGSKALGAASAVKDFLSGGSDNKGQQTQTPDDSSKKIDTGNVRKAQVKSYKPGASDSESAIDKARRKTLLQKDYQSSTAKQVNENKISDIRKMIDEGYDDMRLAINGRSVTLNTGMAKRILEVYDSVNTKNKKIVESMLNEDLESFKKLLNFSIRK